MGAALNCLNVAPAGRAGGRIVAGCNIYKSFYSEAVRLGGLWLLKYTDKLN
jgi:hypothetical protein